MNAITPSLAGTTALLNALGEALDLLEEFLPEEHAELIRLHDVQAKAECELLDQVRRAA
jgi:hypothetical protein